MIHARCNSTLRDLVIRGEIPPCAPDQCVVAFDPKRLYTLAEYHEYVSRPMLRMLHCSRCGKHNSDEVYAKRVI